MQKEAPPTQSTDALQEALMRAMTDWQIFVNAQEEILVHRDGKFVPARDIRLHEVFRRRLVNLLQIVLHRAPPVESGWGELKDVGDMIEMEYLRDQA